MRRRERTGAPWRRLPCHPWASPCRSEGHGDKPTAAVLHGRRVERTPRAGAGQLDVTPVDVRERDQVAALSAAMEETGVAIAVAFCDEDDPGREPMAAAASHSARFHPAVKHGIVLVPRPWTVGSSLAWSAGFRRLTCDFERRARRGAAPHLVMSACPIRRRFLPTLRQGIDTR